MAERVKHRVAPAIPWLVVAVMALLAVGTVSNQLKINAANTQLKAQAMNGQRALNRQCALLPISEKLYADAVARRVIVPAELGLIVSTGEQYCPAR